MGPCVVSHDKYGNSLFEQAAATAELDRLADGGRANISPVSDTRSEGDVTDAKKIAASPSLHALPVPGKSPAARALSGPPTSGGALADGLSPAALVLPGAAANSSFDSLTPSPLSPTGSSSSATPITSILSALAPIGALGGSKASSRRLLSTALPSPSRGKGVLTYVLTAKCSTEFLGYLSLLGNYALVHAASGSVSSKGATDIADAAGGLLSMPRVKHALAQKAQQEHGRLRTESF
jgi:hypothetical protein